MKNKLFHIICCIFMIVNAHSQMHNDINCDSIMNRGQRMALCGDLLIAPSIGLISSGMLVHNSQISNPLLISGGILMAVSIVLIVKGSNIKYKGKEVEFKVNNNGFALIF